MASEKITAIIEELKTLTVLELSDLVHAVEDEFGVSAAAAVVAAAVVDALPLPPPHAVRDASNAAANTAAASLLIFMPVLLLPLYVDFRNN